MKLFKSLLGIFVIFILVLSTSQFKHSSLYQYLTQNTTNLLEFVKYKLRIVKQNVSEEMNPQRKRPLSLMRHEDKLTMFAPQTFKEFTRYDWDEFWDLIFGHKEVGEGLIKQKVQRDREEIEEHLGTYYPNPFFNFNQQRWDQFWSIIFSKND